MRLGPTPTRHGPAEVEITPCGDKVRVSWKAAWRDKAPLLDLAVPGCVPVSVGGDSGPVLLDRLGPTGEVWERS
jgi:hypothetical protein